MKKNHRADKEKYSISISQQGLAFDYWNHYLEFDLRPEPPHCLHFPI